MRIFLLSILILIHTYGFGQNLISAETIETQTATSLNIILLFAGSSIRVDHDVELVRVTYNTMGSDGEMDMASGLFIFPLATNSAIPLHCHLHGTTTREDVPSTQGGGYELGLFYAGLGQFVAMPDYLGMGSSRGFHPYLHRATEASASIDMLFAAQEFAESREDITLSDQLIIAGYSQGGHAAMAVQQSIETTYSNEFDLIAATPMSGPYNLSGAFKDFIISEEEYFFPGYLLYQFIGYNEVDGNLYNSLDDLLKEPYRASAKEFESTGIDLGILHQKLIALLTQNEGKSIPIKMLKDDYVEAFVTNDDHILNMVLRENDTYNFTASAPTRIIYCRADDQVPYQNSITAESILKSNGSINVTSIDVLSSANHGGCVIPAVEESIRFINQFLQSTPTFEVSKTLDGISFYPNPAFDFIKVTSDASNFKMESLLIYDMSASLVKKAFFNREEYLDVDVSDLQAGTYALEIRTSKGSVWQKMIKH